MLEVGSQQTCSATAAAFPAQVAVTLGTGLMCVFGLVLLLFQRHVGRLFSSDMEVVQLTTQAIIPLAASLIGALMCMSL